MRKDSRSRETPERKRLLLRFFFFVTWESELVWEFPARVLKLPSALDWLIQPSLTLMTRRQPLRINFTSTAHPNQLVMVLMQCLEKNSEISNRPAGKSSVIDYLCLWWVHNRKRQSLQNVLCYKLHGSKHISQAFYPQSWSRTQNIILGFSKWSFRLCNV